MIALFFRQSFIIKKIIVIRIIVNMNESRSLSVIFVLLIIALFPYTLCIGHIFQEGGSFASSSQVRPAQNRNPQSLTAHLSKEILDNYSLLQKRSNELAKYQLVCVLLVSVFSYSFLLSAKHFCMIEFWRSWEIFYLYISKYKNFYSDEGDFRQLKMI